MVEDPLALATLIAALVALGLALERRFGWAAKVGASLLVILGGALLSNLEIVPLASPVYDLVFGPVTSLAIAWLLLAVDLRDLRRAGPRMLGAFGFAVAATIVGALVATALFARPLAPDGWKLAGVMVGTYSGGSLNFVSVGRALELPASLFTAATAADNLLTGLWMGATLLLPAWLGRFYPPPADLSGEAPPAESAAAAGDDHEPAGASAGAPGKGRRGHRSPEDDTAGAGGLGPLHAGAPLRILDLSLLLTLGLGLLWAADAAETLLPQVPAVLWLTTFALAVAQLPAVRRLEGALQLGTLALNLFFVAIGIGSRVAEIFRVGPEVFYFTATVVAVHGLLTNGLARLARFDVETTSVASQAAVGGPSTAMALAIARRQPHLALPGVMVGLLGYALGTYAGLVVAYLLRGGG